MTKEMPWRKGLLVAGASLVGAGVAALAGRKEAAIGHWRSPAAEQAYRTAYTAAFARLPVGAEALDLATDFGTVRVYRWQASETAERTPIVLLPGRSSGVPMWVENLPDLVARRPVYALDALGDSGLSVQTAPIRTMGDQALWLDQTLAQLESTSVHLVGHSFGGWLAANYASHYPQRLATMALLEPVYVFQGIKPGVLLQILPATLPFLPLAVRTRAIKAIAGTDDLDLTDPLVAMIAAGTNQFAARLPQPQQITPEQMRRWTMPVYVAMATNSALHDGTKAITVAQAHVAQVQPMLWPNATHSLPMEYPRPLDADLLAFMARHEASAV